MRWITLDPTNPDDARMRRDGLDKIERFWETFASEVASEVQDGQKGVPPMLEALARVSDKIMWEMAPMPKPELTLTPENNPGMRPFVKEMVAKAPNLPGWSFFDRRPPLHFSQVRPSAEAKSRAKSFVAGMNLKLNKVGLIEVSLVYPPVGGSPKGDFVVWCEGLFGEEGFDQWTAPGKQSRKLVKVSDNWIEAAHAEYESLKSQHLATRPNVRWRENESDKGFIVKATFGEEQAIMSVRDADLAWAQVADHNFASARFSRFGETFAYIQLPRMEVSERSAIEDRLEHQLRSEGIGGLTGAHTWYEHSRIDLAIEDLGRISELQAMLAGMSLPNPSWLRFYDRDLKDEWLGFPNNHTPPPPIPPYPSS